MVGFYASEKLNGCRAYWDGERFWTREGRAIDAPAWFTKDLPKIHLDGEIHAGRGAGRGNDNTGYKVAMTAVVQGGDWWDKTDMGEKIRFTTFDVPELSGSWLSRMLRGVGVPDLRWEQIQDPKHLVEYMMELRRVGAEGAMFRNPDEIGYHAGRTGSLLRWKF